MVRDFTPATYGRIHKRHKNDFKKSEFLEEFYQLNSPGIDAEKKAIYNFHNYQDSFWKPASYSARRLSSSLFVVSIE